MLSELISAFGKKQVSHTKLSLDNNTESLKLWHQRSAREALKRMKDFAVGVGVAFFFFFNLKKRTIASAVSNSGDWMK